MSADTGDGVVDTNDRVVEGLLSPVVVDTDTILGLMVLGFATILFANDGGNVE